MRNKSWGAPMSDLIEEMHAGIAELAGPREWHDTRDSWLNRAAKRAGISFNMARAFFYRQSTNPEARNVERVRAALRKLTADHAGQDEDHDRIAALKARLDEAHAEIDRLERGLAELRDLVLAGAQDRPGRRAGGEAGQHLSV